MALPAKVSSSLKFGLDFNMKAEYHTKEREKKIH
jgi:hypothetical protein